MPGRATFRIEFLMEEVEVSSSLFRRIFLIASRAVVGAPVVVVVVDSLAGRSGVEGLVRDSRTRWNLRFLVSSA